MLPARSIAACGSDYRFCPQDRAERTTRWKGIVQDARKIYLNKYITY